MSLGRAFMRSLPAQRIVCIPRLTLFRGRHAASAHGSGTTPLHTWVSSKFQGSSCARQLRHAPRARALASQTPSAKTPKFNVASSLEGDSLDHKYVLRIVIV